MQGRGGSDPSSHSSINAGALPSALRFSCKTIVISVVVVVIALLLLLLLLLLLFMPVGKHYWDTRQNKVRAKGWAGAWHRSMTYVTAKRLCDLPVRSSEYMRLYVNMHNVWLCVCE